jgi:hypothetical protein
VQRLGGSYEENPRGICTLFDTRAPSPSMEPIHAFNFAVHDTTAIPRYTLNDRLLQAILAAMKKTSPLPLAGCIFIDDERIMLRPLDTIMVHTFEEVGILAPEVEYLGVGR